MPLDRQPPGRLGATGEDEGYLFYEGIADLVYPLSARGWIQLASMEGDDDLRLFAQLPAMGLSSR